MISIWVRMWSRAVVFVPFVIVTMSTGLLTWASAMLYMQGHNQLASIAAGLTVCFFLTAIFLGVVLAILFGREES